ncbi:hypothetical protein B1209_15605 [Raoultella planticola]|jgi:hypothetical protein|uniref:Uncharacterized protein n=1 Tax=Raoultella planticola TaxID=575 RepID=A0A443VHQ6_RAOPL|nr:hypothetical protein CRT62_15380 [Raoultella planticola]ATM16886.1 hypothetical protein CRN15_19470 [Raoultella planticola]AUU05835.1 hypothetical protein MC50_019280 [Raoultella planticola]AUV53990.1 hypothetical protein B1209_15605 [Raoultella planticola]NYY80153.1 hypothetical protein [Raoultella planticola]
MLIKLRNEFYQVQCDAFGDLATDLLDIRPKILRAMSPDEQKSVNSAIWFYGCETGRAEG